MKAVIVIEDEIDIAELENLILEPLYNVKVVSDDFSKVFNSIFWKDIDIAFVDFILESEIDGGNIISYLYKHHPDIKRILITATPDLARDILSLVDLLIKKPFAIKDFLQRVSDLDCK